MWYLPSACNLRSSCRNVYHCCLCFFIDISIEQKVQIVTFHIISMAISVFYRPYTFFVQSYYYGQSYYTFISISEKKLSFTLSWTCWNCLVTIFSKKSVFTWISAFVFCNL